MSSINTNIGALVALRNITALASNELVTKGQPVETHVVSGYRISSPDGVEARRSRGPTPNRYTPHQSNREIARRLRKERK